ncbi:hypothetical protein FTX61_16050 [Nitriliruptoraceae bacterium ZYF776]|nr:hypothetical protein [Profundirhabdus halotolerans]
MSGVGPPDHDATDTGAAAVALSLDVRRGRQVRRVLLVGAALALASGVVLAAIGTDAPSVLAATFVVLALVFGVASLVGLVTALVDEWRGHRVPRRRLLVAVAQLFAVPVCLLVAAGAVGASA